MAHDKAIHRKVRASFVQGLPLTSAAELHGVSYQTARNWKRRDSVDGHDWDVDRRARLLTKSGMQAMTNQILDELALQFTATIEALKKDEKMSAQTRAETLLKLSDGYAKAIAAASRASPSTNRLATAMDVVRFLSEFIGKQFPALRAKFVEIAEAAGDDLVREFGGGR